MKEETEFITAVISKKQFNRRLDQVLAEIFPCYSRSSIKKWILHQNVVVNGKIWNKPKKKVKGDEVVSINTKAKEKEIIKPQKIPLNIIYEDSEIIIINKQHNLIIHPGAGNSDGTIINALLHYYPPIADVPRIGIVHRLDKDTTGLLVVAKTISAYTRLTEDFRLHKITREYEALVKGCITEDGTIEYPIKRHLTKRTCMSVHPMGKLAITHYRIMERFRSHTLLRIRLETGRTHQIRVHMLHIAHPIVGDQIYRGRLFPLKNLSMQLIDELKKFNRQALHARMLRFYHPISNIKMEWYAPIPEDMSKLINIMRLDCKEKV